MNEQSHKREMAAALRSDFARLRERGVVTTIGAGATAGAVDAAEPTPDRQDEATEQGSVVRRFLLIR